MIKKLRNMKKSVWLAICFSIGLIMALLILVVGFGIKIKIDNEGISSLNNKNETVELITSSISSSPGITENTETEFSIEESTIKETTEDETTTSVYGNISKDSTTVSWKDINGNVYDDELLIFDVTKLPDEVFIKLRDGYGLLKPSIYRFIYNDNSLRSCTEVSYVKDSIKEKSNNVELTMELNDKKRTRLKCSFNKETKQMKIEKLKQ